MKKLLFAVILLGGLSTAALAQTDKPASKEKASTEAKHDCSSSKSCCKGGKKSCSHDSATSEKSEKSASCSHGSGKSCCMSHGEAKTEGKAESKEKKD